MQFFWYSIIIFLVCTDNLLGLEFLKHQFASCQRKIEEAHIQLCTNFNRKIFIGTLCPHLCYNGLKTSEISFTGCPDSSNHIGKEFVAFAKDKSDVFLVVKSSALIFEESLEYPLNRYFENGTNYISKSISTLLSELIKYDQIQLVTPWLISDIKSPNVTELFNLWLLVQQNEYVLGKLFSKQLKIYPEIVSTCGQFYTVKKLNEILDWSYFVPHFSMIKVFRNLFVCLSLIVIF